MSKFKVGDRVVFKFTNSKDSVTSKRQGWSSGMNTIFELPYITVESELLSRDCFPSEINGKSFTFDEHDFVLYEEEEMTKFKVGDRVVFKFKSKKESVTDRKHGWLREMNAVFKLSYITIDKIFPGTFHSEINGKSFTFDEHDFILYKEEEEVEYKIKPHITFGEIYEKVVDLRCDDALREWDSWTRDCLEEVWAIFLSSEIPQECFERFVYNNPKRLRFALKHGFVEKIEKETYKLGDLFMNDIEVNYRLVSIGANNITLIKNTSIRVVKVQDINNITEEEFCQLAGNKFKKVV